MTEFPEPHKEVTDNLWTGCVIPAHPLALTAERRLDERYQRALTRYYASAGVGGVAVGVHTTQFEIREPQYGLLQPVLELAIETLTEIESKSRSRLIRVAGICGNTSQAVAEAEQAVSLGYDLGLLSLGGVGDVSEDALIDHCYRVAQVIPLFGFYLHATVGGRILPYSFWRKFVEIPNVKAIKTAPFNRYQTLDVVRAVADSGRQNEIALYTGNDDNIVGDLLARYRFSDSAENATINYRGGLLGHWAFWTSKAVRLLEEVKDVKAKNLPIPQEWLVLANRITDANAAAFDPQNGFAGCIPGINEILRRQGLLPGNWCLNPDEVLSQGQAEEIDRVYRCYPELNDDRFVEENLQDWLR